MDKGSKRVRTVCRSCGHESVFMDSHTWQHRNIDADPTALLYHHPFDVLKPLFGSAHKVIIRGHKSRCHKNAVLQDRVRSYMDGGLQLDIAANAAVGLYRHATPDDRAIADGHVLTDGRHVCYHDALANCAASVKDGIGADNGV